MRTVSIVENFQESVVRVCDDCYYEDSLNTFNARMHVRDDDVSLGEKCSECGAFSDAKISDPEYRPHLFSLSEASAEIAEAQGGLNTTVASAKLAGKLLVNTAVISGKFGWKIVQSLAEQHNKKQQKDTSE